MKYLISFGAAAATATLSLSAFAQASEPAQVNPVVFVDQFESSFGKYEGFRRSGAKGICATGVFTGTEQARALSTASAFSGNSVPVVIRFSVGGANPNAADNNKSQRNMALQFNLPDGELWQMGNISSPVFGASTPQQFFQRVVSLQPDPVTKKRDPAKVKAFSDGNPDVLLQGKYLASQPVPASFGALNYWGVHAFSFTNADGDKQYGKWIFEPVSGVEGLSDEEAEAKGPNFLNDDLRQRVENGQVAFNFNLELAQDGDVLNNATVPLPDGREKVNLGQLTLTSVSEDASGECLTITYIPTVLPKGVEASDDPLLTARAAPYAVGLSRRLGEGAKQ